MTIHIAPTGTIELTGTCSSEEGEILLQHLSASPNIMVDWRGCEAAHTAVIQVLLATRPRMLGPPASVLLEKWVQPALAATVAK